MHSGAQLMLPRNFKDTCEVSHMLGQYFAFYNYIINIDFNAPTQLWFEHLSHHPLINRPCVFQTKGHHFVVIISSRSNKSYFFLIIQCQWYLMILLKSIQETHSRMSYCCIHQLIYPRHRERVFGTSLIEICEIHMHTPFSCFLFH